MLKRLRRVATTQNPRDSHLQSPPGCSSFQVPRVVISPNIDGVERNAHPGRECLVVSADQPAVEGETAEQRQAREQANADRAQRRQEEARQDIPAAAAPGNANVNAEGNNGAVHQQAQAVPRQQRHDDQVRKRIRARDLQRDFEEAGHEVYNSPQANLGVAMVGLQLLPDTPAIRRALAHVRVANTQVEERSQGQSRSAATYHSKSRSVRQGHDYNANRPLLVLAEEGGGENEVQQHAGTDQHQGRGAQRLNQVNQRRERDEAEIARRAEYNRLHGPPGLLEANNPAQAADL